MKHLISILALLASISASAETYKVIAPIPESEDGDMVYLFNFDTKAKIDSVEVAHGTATFTGEIDEPIVARIIGEDQTPYGTFFLEQGTIAIDQTKHRAVGSMLNDQYNEMGTEIGKIITQYQNASTDLEKENAYNAYLTFFKNAIDSNLDSPIGYYVFLDFASTFENPETLIKYIEARPALKQYQRVQKLIEASQRRLATSEGKPFVDFEVTYDGKTTRLSDYVGKGKYTLVDFWASWCGPCMREIPVIKEIYNQYHDKGLQVLGVATWDEPENTMRAIEQQQIPWPTILNSQSIGSDAYGISGIPCIILFGPDGTIVSRDARGDDLKAVIAREMAK